jgi:hypothetical protein
LVAEQPRIARRGALASFSIIIIYYNNIGRAVI